MKILKNLGFAALAVIAVFVFAFFYLIFLTRTAYVQNDFVQNNHALLAFISLGIAVVIFLFNFKPGKGE